MSDAQERTERATPKRLREAREKGQIQTSKDLSSWLGVGAGAATLVLVGQGAADLTTRVFGSLATVIADPQPEVAVALLDQALADAIPVMAPLFVAVVVTAIAGVALQGGIHRKKMKLSGKNFDLVAGTKRIFGLQALWEGGKALLKTAVIGLVLWSVLQGLVPVLMASGHSPLRSILDSAASGVTALLQSAVIAGLALAAVDVLVVQRRNRKHTFMTKKEFRDEHKRTEGDPLVKSQRRARQLAISRNRMIAAVGGADVVLLNPTHVAVALKYDAGRGAPRVVAKGADRIAFRIREKAAEEGVPMVEDIVLARALHAACDIGQEIPAELYTGVARVLAFVQALRRRGSVRGTHRLARAFA